MKTLCIIFGGVNSEHEVSRRSAASVLENITPGKYRVMPLGITKDGRWLLYDGPVNLMESGEWETSGHTRSAIISPDRSHGGIVVLGDKPETIRVDVAFGVLHGKNGEDGTMQGLFELAGIPYVGCGVLSSALCMDKAIAHTLLVGAGVPKTRLEVVKEDDLDDLALLEARLAESLGYPMFVKPANAGSSVGVTRVGGSGELPAALNAAFAHDKKVVVEQEVRGQEVESSVMGGKKPIVASVLGEIAPTVGFYDYDAKYMDDTAKLYIPAHLDEKTADRIKEVALMAYKALDCEGFARVDFFVREDGEVILNEINTIPGFTSISMFPKLFGAAGVSYSELIDKLVETAFER